MKNKPLFFIFFQIDIMRSNIKSYRLCSYDSCSILFEQCLGLPLLQYLEPPPARYNFVGEAAAKIPEAAGHAKYPVGDLGPNQYAQQFVAEVIAVVGEHVVLAASIFVGDGLHDLVKFAGCELGLPAQHFVAELVAGRLWGHQQYPRQVGVQIPNAVTKLHVAGYPSAYLSCTAVWYTPSPKGLKQQFALVKWYTTRLTSYFVLGYCSYLAIS